MYTITIFWGLQQDNANNIITCHDTKKRPQAAAVGRPRKFFNRIGEFRNSEFGIPENSLENSGIQEFGI